ncbi:MAG: radical SAM protein [Syntrophobacterales bacterium]|nr:MAG: radical SAM protein [Syntrophobacterales bacterium]
MSILRGVKGYSRKLIVRKMVQMLPKLSMKNMSKIIDLGESLITRDDHKAIAESLKNYIEEGHPAVKLIEKVLYKLSPECRYRTIYNLFILALLDKTSVRESLKKELGFRPPFFFVISPTMRCNLKCYGCYAGEYEQASGLSHEVLDRIIREAQELGIHFITFSGGEPFIRADLLDLYEKHRDVIFQVYTNGTLIDEKIAKRLARLGNVAPMISMEGFERETDERRGKGHFEKAMRTMDYLRQEGVLFGSSVTQTRENIYTISSDEFVDMLVEKGAFLIWYFQYIPIGRKPDMSMMLTPQQRDIVRRRLRKIRATKPLFICDFWNDGSYIDGCLAAGREYFHINANGDVEPCVFAHFAVDNINEKSLKEVLASEFFREIRSRQPFSENPLMPCMIIDNPHDLREVVRKCHAYPTHAGAETLITDLAREMDKYAMQYHRIADRTWRNEYAGECKKAIAS